MQIVLNVTCLDCYLPQARDATVCHNCGNADLHKCDCEYPNANNCYMETRTRGILDDLELARVEFEEDYGQCECPCHQSEDY